MHFAHHLFTASQGLEKTLSSSNEASDAICGHMNLIRECGSTLYVGMAQGVSFSLYIGIGAKFENMQKTGERRLCRAEYRTVLL